MFGNMRWDAWEAVGLGGELLFFARLIAQWLASERERRPVVPTVYWYLSLAGTGILIAYALHIGSFAILVPQLVGVVLYSRNLQLDFGHRRMEGRLRRLGLLAPDYSWPDMSVVVPAHNEEKRLSGTLENLASIFYPGKLEIIVALNGCTDGSAAVARRHPVRVVESERSGMSFGKNLGAAEATGKMLVFVDADTCLPADAFRKLAIAAALSESESYIGTVAGSPDRGGLVVRACFRIANWATFRKRAHAPGGVMLMDRGTFDRIGGFNENIPQGTSTDCIWRALKSGAAYVFVDSFRAVTSIRRFEKTGVVGQMLSWRRNHRALAAGGEGRVAGGVYEDIR